MKKEKKNNWKVGWNGYLTGSLSLRLEIGE
jgi:hypothetical protein